MALAQPFPPAEITAWQQRAQTIEIVRDTWGIPHIYGKTDADAVFGAIYAQCEDDFARVEENYIDAIGRMAEVQGEEGLLHDLRARMFLDSTQAVAIYRSCPAWMKSLLEAFADGANYYLATHPEVKPRLLTRFAPWMPLTFTEGSIGGNITVISLERMKRFYASTSLSMNSASLSRHPTSLSGRTGGPSTSSGAENDPVWQEKEPTGSNGFAIAPSRSASGNALLLINPHTSYYFRSEQQVVSEQGLNAYGAVTWGQFFIYQGFNQHCGWMHTSSFADSMDEYEETVEKRNGRFYYKYGKEWRPVQEQQVELPYKSGDRIARKTFTIYRTHHGPIIGEQNGKWIAISMMNEPLDALSQSYLRTKARDYRSFNKVMKIRTNSSNNTVFADDKGNIAYWHGDFIPKRNQGFDWNEPVDGSNPATDWKGLHKVRDIVQMRNPATGWIQNCNSTPFTVSGASSPEKEDYPAYMAPDFENYRGINAARVLSRRAVYTLDTLIAAANDPYLAGFEELVPSLVSALGQVHNPSADLTGAAETLKNWDLHYGEASVATTLAVYWGEKMMTYVRSQLHDGRRRSPEELTSYMIKAVTTAKKTELFEETLEQLNREFGSWRTPWGAVNRFQRLTGKIDETFDDKKPSIPVGFTSSLWGSLASFGARTYPGTVKRYGSGGNSFVAVVEFGERLKARAVVSGGQASRPDSPHFTDQADLFCKGQFREVWFYPEEVRAHQEAAYHPGDRKR